MDTRMDTRTHTCTHLAGELDDTTVGAPEAAAVDLQLAEPLLGTRCGHQLGSKRGFHP